MEPLTHQQCIQLFQVLASFSPWLAMLTLLQLFIGDRADCAMHLDMDYRPIYRNCPSDAGQPTIAGSMVCRICLNHLHSFSRQRSTRNPLAASSGETWPVAGQPVFETNMPLFPGFDRHGQERGFGQNLCQKGLICKKNGLFLIFWDKK